MSIFPKTEQRRRRLMLVIVLVFGLSTSLILLSLPGSGGGAGAISFFYSPTDIVAGKAPAKRNIDIGGIVVEGSRKQLDDGVTVQFAVTDMKNNITVRYKGILPDMFEEGKGAVAKGKLDDKGILVANIVLAKHDEKYMPPVVKKALEKQKLNSTLKLKQ